MIELHPFLFACIVVGAFLLGMLTLLIPWRKLWQN